MVTQSGHLVLIHNLCTRNFSSYTQMEYIASGLTSVDAATYPTSRMPNFVPAGGLQPRPSRRPAQVYRPFAIFTYKIYKAMSRPSTSTGLLSWRVITPGCTHYLYVDLATWLLSFLTTLLGSAGELHVDSLTISTCEDCEEVWLGPYSRRNRKSGAWIMRCDVWCMSPPGN